MLEKCTAYLGYFIIFLAISGGVYFRGTNWNAEVSQIDVFGILFLLCILLITFKNRIVSKGTNNSLADFSKKILDIKDPSKWLRNSFFFVFGFLFLGHLMRFAAFDTNIFDMNCLHQPLFFPFSPNFFHCNTCRMNTQFAEHMVWTLVPLSIITQFLKSDIFIFLIQNLSVAVPLWIFIKNGPLAEQRQHAFWFFILFCLMQPWRNGLIFDFREDQFGFGLTLLMLTALFNQQFKLVFLFSFLIMLTKENFPVVTLLFSVVLLLEKSLPLPKLQRRLTGLGIMILSLVIVVITHKFLIPYFMGASESKNNILRLFPGMGNTMAEFFQNVLSHPLEFLTHFAPRFFSTRALYYIAMLLLPSIAWGFQFFHWTIPGLLMMALNIMSQNDGQSSGSFHYEFIVLPYIIFAIALSIHRQSKNFNFKQLHGRWIWTLSIALVFAGRGPAFEFTDRLIYNWDKIPAAITVSSWNPEGPIAANSFILTHFNHVQEQRLLRLPSKDSVNTNENERIKIYVNSNFKIPIIDQTRDIHDATDYILVQNDPWEKSLTQDLIEIGGTIKATAYTARGEKFLVWIRLAEPALKTWCEKKSICSTTNL